MTFDTKVQIRVEAPSAAAAFLLEDELGHPWASAVRHDALWCVELEKVDGSVDAVLAAVRGWLDEIGSRSAEVWVDGVRRTVTVRGAEPLGSGYDGPSLEHEP